MRSEYTIDITSVISHQYQAACGTPAPITLCAHDNALKGIQTVTQLSTTLSHDTRLDHNRSASRSSICGRSSSSINRWGHAQSNNRQGVGHRLHAKINTSSSSSSRISG